MNQELWDKEVMAMYDVRGIQNYIFKTSKLQDAIGASAIVENIIDDALMSAINDYNNQSDEKLQCDIEWEDKENNTYVAYNDSDRKDITVLYTGGGNSFICYSSGRLCTYINQRMSKYVLDNTYSLQLAIAVVEKTQDYNKDYKDIQNRMFEVKAHMKEARPLGALPVVQVEILTGLPMNADRPKNMRSNGYHSKETYQKQLSEQSSEERKKLQTIAKQFDSYTAKKGDDSIIAVIHIDGNNMGMRIRELVSDKKSYNEAINTMRQLSYNINHSYKNVFNEVQDTFNVNGQYNILKVLVAGDDITYVCKGKYAFASVELFAEQIGKKVMYGSQTDKNIDKYGFSVCAGISFIRSHFPFSVAYEVAESCCDSAKKKAKKEENMLKLKDGTYKVGNWMDYHICKNIHAGDLETMRKREYETKTGEKLLIRPYELPLLNVRDKNAPDKYNQLVHNIEQLTDESRIPRSFAKDIRNTYSLGKNAMERQVAFIRSRGWKLPDSMSDDIKDSTSDNKYQMYNGNTAKWYDVLEVMDYYEPLKKLIGITGEEK